MTGESPLEILLVDDDKTLLEVTRLFIHQKEPTANVTITSSVAEALQRLAERAFDVIVSDYLMPDIDGLAFLKSLRDRGNLIPFILFTGRGREEVAIQALNSGADYYLKKNTPNKGVLGELIHIIRQVVHQRRMEQALQTSEEQFRVTFEEAPIAMAIKDLDGCLLRINPTLEQFLGYTEEELCQLKFTEITHPDDVQLNWELFQELLAGKRRQYQLEKRYIRKDGQIVWGHLTVWLVRDVHGEPRFGIGMVEDITGRRKAELALCEREQRYRALFERTNDAVFLIGLDMTHLEVNQRAAEMLGYEREELIGMTVEQLVVADEYPESLRVYEMLMSRTPVPIYERTFRRKNGSTITGEVNVALVEAADGTPLHIQSVIRDVSERRHADAALRESEEKYRSLIANIPAVIWTTDSEGHTTFISPSVERIYGYTPEEIYQAGDRLFFGRIHPDEVEVVKTAYSALFNTNEEYEVEYRIQRKDGHWIWLYDRAIATYEQDGQRYGYGVFTDITPLKQTEVALRQSEERFAKAFRLSPHVVLISRLADGKIMEVNEAAEKALGYRREELLGRTTLELNIIAPEERERGIWLFRQQGFLKDFEARFYNRAESSSFLQ